jgi:8-oxo-dGTP diphosphatase
MTGDTGRIASDAARSAPAPAHRSGDGFITLADGSRRWGRYGAAGILARHVDADKTVSYFVALRSQFCHQGGTWAIPGGALHHGESPVEGALREFAEEVTPLGEPFEVVDVHQDDHGGWSYWTVLVDVPHRFAPPTHLNWETAEVRWVGAEELTDLELFDSFRATLERLELLPADSGLQ